MTAATAAAVTDIHEALTGVNGLGTATIAKALDAHELTSTTPATPEQLARVADAKAGKKDGLKGKSLAAWIITGQNSTQQVAASRLKAEAANAGKSTPAAATSARSEFIWPKAGAAILLDYLKAEVTGDADAPNKGAPFIDAKGIVRFTGTHWRGWLDKQGMHPGKNEAGVPVREAGLKMRPFALPGESRQMGFYTGPAPKGTASLPRRIVERAARSASSAPRKPANPFSKFTDEQVAYLRTVIAKGKKGDVKDALTALLPPESAPEPPQAAGNGDEAQEPAGEPQDVNETSSPAGEPQES